MNWKNDRQNQEIKGTIYRAFSKLLQEKEMKQITVTELCSDAKIDRSTFYNHFTDMAAFTNAYAAQIEKVVEEQPHTEGEFAWIFDYIKENQELFRTYFKMGISESDVDYMTLFFRKGAFAVAKMWFSGGCVESSKHMGNIIKREYEKLKR